MKKLKLFALAAVALLGFSGAANAEAVLLASDDFVGISFWIISMGMLAATAFFFMERNTVAPGWKTSVTVATVTDVFQPGATVFLSMKKNAVAANIPIEIIQKEIPTKSSDARRTASAFAAPEKPNRATAANANNLSFFIKNSLFS